MRRFSVALIAFLIGQSTASADIITYLWNDEESNSSFIGGLRVDTTRLLDRTDGPGKWLSQSAIIDSQFFFNRNIPERGLFPAYVTMNVTAIEPVSRIAIDPATGAILTDGFLLMGPSSIYYSQLNTPLPPYQVYSARFEFDRDFGVVGPPGFLQGGQTGYGRDSELPGEFLMSVGHWDVSVTVVPTAVPTPPGIILFAFGGGLAIVGRLRKRSPREEGRDSVTTA
jgi:hypothetical protein